MSYRLQTQACWPGLSHFARWAAGSQCDLRREMRGLTEVCSRRYLLLLRFRSLADALDFDFHFLASFIADARCLAELKLISPFKTAWATMGTQRGLIGNSFRYAPSSTPTIRRSRRPSSF